MVPPRKLLPLMSLPLELTRRHSERLRVYIDFDDVICETASSIVEWAQEWYGIEIDYEQIHWFDLRRSLRLADHQYEALMSRVHTTENMLRYPPTAGAVETIARWQRNGVVVVVVTGRPPHTLAASRGWLNAHGLAAVPLIFVDKYGREPPMAEANPRALSPAEFHELTFDVAIEDAPPALDILATSKSCRDGRIFIFDRPWNRNYQITQNHIVRVSGWAALQAAIPNEEFFGFFS